MTKAPKPPKKSAILTIRIDPEVKAKAEIAAGEEDRSLSTWVTSVIKEALKTRRAK